MGDRQGGRAQAAGPGQARRRRHGQDSVRGSRGDDFARARGRAAQARPGGGDRARHARLRAYAFDRYKTKRKEGEEQPAKAQITHRGCRPGRRPQGLEQTREPVADGVIMARDLVNEPPTCCFPEEFARRAAALKKLGVAVEVLDVTAMKKLGMGALLGVGQGSRQDSRARGHALERRQEGRRRRSPSSARACASTPAASRSSPPPAWRT